MACREGGALESKVKKRKARARKRKARTAFRISKDPERSNQRMADSEETKTTRRWQWKSDLELDESNDSAWTLYSKEVSDDIQAQFEAGAKVSFLRSLKKLNNHISSPAHLTPP
jgi:hypothetical protein